MSRDKGSAMVTGWQETAAGLERLVLAAVAVVVEGEQEVGIEQGYEGSSPLA